MEAYQAAMSDKATDTSMDILGVIGRLLDYPSESLFEYRNEICELIRDAKLELQLEEKLLAFVEVQLSKDLMDWQGEYDGLFERGRSLGLWLFEHVHGESRDRGQAMVDLVALYREAGLEISKHELPDYIPLFLEFLSTQGQENAKDWLLDVEHILGLLQCRLEKRESPYSVLFETLLNVAESDIQLNDIRKNIADEKRDDTKKALDKEWEEEEVTFGSESLDKNCGSATRKPSEAQRKDQDIPISWVDFDTSTGKKPPSVQDAMSQTMPQAKGM